MFHSNIELLIDYWRATRGEAPLPTRADIDPADFSGLLPFVFIASRRDMGVYPLRLVGEAVIDLHGKSLRGEDIMRLWAPSHRIELQLAMEQARRRRDPVVISAEGRTDEGAVLTLEVLFAPFAGPDGEADRFLGLYQPLSPVAALRGRPVRELLIRAVGGADARAIGPRLRLAALDGRQIA
ncbi:MAG TPA: PAS domain-containing protein [Caulobacteraceae bacterium]|nr:PAS domain-containing protein [Caulobacteraceae bacterium]